VAIRRETHCLVAVSHIRFHWRLGKKRRLVRRTEWETLFPTDGFFPERSQTFAILKNKKRWRTGFFGAKSAKTSIVFCKYAKMPRHCTVFSFSSSMFFQNPLDLLFIIPAFLLAITLHEAAHAGMAYLLGDPTARIAGRLSLNPFAHLDLLGSLFLLVAGFGWAKPVPINPNNFEYPKRDEALTALAGPLSNFLQALFAMAVFFWSGENAPAFFQEFLIIFIHINLLLCVFNLIPLSPLDGEKIVAAFIPKRWEMNWEKITAYGPLILFSLLGFSAFFGLPFFSEFLGYLVAKAYLVLDFFSLAFFSFPFSHI